MAKNSEWKELREEHDAAWRQYQDAAERVHASFEKFDSGVQDQPAEEDVGELDSAWNRLENARRRLNELMARR